MMMSTLKQKIKNKERIIGTHINLNDVAVSRIVGLAGYDFVWIDLEHSYMALEQLMAHLMIIKGTGTAVIVRVPQDDLTYTKKVVEMGVDGIIFPMIRSAKQAKTLIDATLYPPVGNRGFGPMNAVGFGFDDVIAYVDNTVDNLCRFIQIEHIDAVGCLDELVQNEYIDGYIFGPNDLSGSIGQLCRVFEDDTLALIEKSISILRAADKFIGLSTGDTNPAVFRRWWDMGIDMLSAAADFGMLQQGNADNRRNLERAVDHPNLYKNKVFFTKDNLTPDVNCSLLPPNVFGPEAADADCYAAAYRKWQSAPCISKAYGKLFCCFSGDNFGGDEQPNNYNVVMCSDDEGITWQTACVIDHMDAVRLHEPILWTAPDGTLWHMWAQSYEWWDGRGGVWAMKLTAKNGAVKWSRPRRLCDGVMACPPTTRADGRVLVPVSIWNRWRDRIHSFPNWGESSVYVTDADLTKLTYLGGTRAATSGFDENAVVERADGSLLMIIRCDRHIASTVSRDGGQTWSEPAPMMAHTSSRSYLTKLPSGHYLLVTNDSATCREKMTAFLSTDECQTWTATCVLDAREAVSYPAGCVNADGRVYVAWDYNRYTDEEVWFTSFTEDDLVNGTVPEKRLVSKGGRGQVTDKVYEAGQ